MRHLLLSLLIFHIASAAIAQKPAVNEFAATDQKALQVPDSLTQSAEKIAGYINTHFGTDKEKARAIFIWIVSNIAYDAENMFAINFYESMRDRIEKPLKTRKGICSNYAALFNDLCTKTGIKSVVIEGYTKQNGFADYIPHAWCAARIDDAWLMFDPTWGSGYISNAKLVKKVNNYYFSASPATLIKSHMPFDLMWQFLNYPVTNQEFYEGRTQQNNAKPFFNYRDSIKVYEKQNYTDQLQSTALRIEKNGIKNSMIFDRLQHIRLELERHKQATVVDLYNTAAAYFNQSVNRLNEFIDYRNKRFVPAKTDAEIQGMIDSTDAKLKEASAKLAMIQGADPATTALITQLNKSVADVSFHVKEQQDWLKLYFGKTKSGRKLMFRKYTWLGIPLN